MAYDIFLLISAIVVVVSAIGYIVFMKPSPTPTNMPTYCEACHTRVEYDYERNCYFCLEHGKLIFLHRGIPIELISGWYNRLEEAEG